MRALDAAFDRLLTALAALAAAIFGAMALLISVNVVLRNLGLPTLFGLLDAVEYGLLAATFLAAPWVLARNAHVTIDLVTAALPQAAARRAARAAACIGLAVSGTVAVYGAEAALASAARGSMVRTALVFPEWWALAIVPVAFALIALEFLRQIVRPPALSRTASGL